MLVDCFVLSFCEKTFNRIGTKMRKNKVHKDKKKAHNLMLRKNGHKRPKSVNMNVQATKDFKMKTTKKYTQNKPTKRLQKVTNLQKPTKLIKGKNIKHENNNRNKFSDSHNDDDMEVSELDSDSEVSDSEVNSYSENENKQLSTAGLANVMSSILSKKTDKKVILVKSKTDKEITINKLKQKREDDDKEGDSEREDGTVVFDKANEKNIVDVNSDDEDLLQNRELKREKRIKKKTWEDMARSKPNLVADKENEDKLKKIALRGVLQLFNAVHKQQRKIKETVETVGPSERKREKAMKSISKGEFMDMLKGTTANVADKPKSLKTEEKSKLKSTETTKSKPSEKPSWNVLQQDFMMGAKMKDWDRESDSDEDMDTSHPGHDDISDSDHT